ncbi:MAG TPA: hypothetical protein VGI82_04375 [Chitinophagaceae bacterium]
MEPAQPSQSSIPASSTATTASTGLFGTKIPSTTAFLIAVLLFFLPFAEIRCNGEPLASNTGVGIAIGTDWREVVTKNIFGGGFHSNSRDNSFDESDKRKQDPNKFAIAALGLGIVGLLLAFAAPKGGGTAGVVIGILAAVSLVAMLFDLKSKIKSENSLKSSDLNVDASVGVTVDGTIAFYFAIILFILAAVFSWQRSKTST